MKKPLEGLIVLEFSQFLSGPSAGLRLADLGARVIKIERPKYGDSCRQLSLKNLFVDDDSLLFHTINRNKESFTADLKNPEDLRIVKKLIERADVITHNFRPRVMEKIGLDYNAVKQINNQVIYAEISGYGKIGPLKDKPGQDLLVQAISGLAYLTGNEQENLVPFGLSIADIFCGAHVVQGVLAALILRQHKKIGAYIEVSLLESILDFQFEFLTTWLNGGGLPQRGKVNNAHSLLSAPYGIYKTADNYIALAMSNLDHLSEAIDLPDIHSLNIENTALQKDVIKQLIANHVTNIPSEVCLQKLKNFKIWSMPVLNWRELKEKNAYKSLDIEQEVLTANGTIIQMMRGAIKFNNQGLFSQKPAPILGADTNRIKQEFLLN